MTLKRTLYYQLMYPNNFIYIEEYPLILLAIILLATIRPMILCVSITLVTTITIFLLTSPRSPLRHANNCMSALTEDKATTRPHISSLPALLRTNDGELKDELGRRIHLRGVNVGGKLPLGHTTWMQPPVPGSFVGTLFELSSIKTHLRRLASCGFTILRLNITWEALEPEVEGVYDTQYINYLVSVVRECAQHNMYVVIDSHQDAWSRWTGGDGAPKWTMERLGMDTAAFPHTRSAMLHCADTGHLTWFTNYTLYGAGTMFALFFGGNRFAPNTRVNGVGVQEWLQSAYIRAWCEVGKVLAKEPNVLGFEPMNEPSAGWIGIPDLNRLPLPGYMGWDLTPWDSIRLANGDSLDVASFPCVNAYKRSERANTSHHVAWKRTYTDVWKENGVWGVEEGLLKPEHFKLKPDESFESSFLTPFHRRFALAILQYNARWWIVCYPKLPSASIHPGIPISAPHWYDNITLVMNRYIPFLALSDDQSIVYPYPATKAHKHALERLTPSAGGPYLLGEVGIPWLGSVRNTSQALEATMTAVDSRFLSAATIWNYNAHHTEEKGDGWNLEDFSIWSPARSCFRMPNAIRPYPMVLAGKPVSTQWLPFNKDKPFTLTFDVTDDTRSDTSLIFIPEMHYRNTHLVIWTNDGGCVKHDWMQQTVQYKHRRDAGASRRKVLKISCV
jgi:hypothetical protein